MKKLEIQMEIVKKHEEIKKLYEELSKIGGKGGYCESCGNRIDGVHFCCGKSSGKINIDGNIYSHGTLH